MGSPCTQPGMLTGLLPVTESFANGAAEIGPILEGPEREKRGRAGSQSDRCEFAASIGKQPLAGSVVGHKRHIAQAEMLAKAFVVAENEKLVFLDGAAERGAEFVALELGDIALVEEIARVQIAVAEEFINTAVKLVCSGSRDDTDLRAGALAVLGAIGIRNYIELAYGIDAEQLPACAARGVVDFRSPGVFDAIQQKKNFLRAVAGDGEHVAHCGV